MLGLSRTLPSYLIQCTTRCLDACSVLCIWEKCFVAHQSDFFSGQSFSDKDVHILEREEHWKSLGWVTSSFLWKPLTQDQFLLGRRYQVSGESCTQGQGQRLCFLKILWMWKLKQEVTSDCQMILYVHLLGRLKLGTGRLQNFWKHNFILESYKYFWILDCQLWSKAV